MIRQYLAKLGKEPTDHKRLIYPSPITDEKTPSFRVTPNGKGWRCFSSDQGGGLVDLVAIVEKMPKNTKRDIAKIYEKAGSATTNYVAPVRQEPSTTERKRVEFVNIQKGVSMRFLQDYMSGRGIPTQYHNLMDTVWLLDTKYERKFSGVGLMNQSDGYTYRNGMKYFSKGNFGKSDITIVKQSNTTNKWCVVEGNFSYLSMVVLIDSMKKPQPNFIILNSVTNTDRAIKELETHKDKEGFGLVLALDNDTTGDKGFLLITDKFPKAFDFRKYHRKFNDTNDLLTGNPITERKPRLVRDGDSIKVYREGKLSQTVAIEKSIKTTINSIITNLKNTK